MQELIWKPILRFNGEYEVSNTGLIRSTYKVIEKSNGKKYTRVSKILKHAIDKSGYLRVAVSFNGELKTQKVHRLVAWCFVNGDKDATEVNHKDGNKLNNHYSNLEWVNRSENMKHAYSNKLINPKRGESNGNSKLNAEQVKEIRQVAESSGRYYGRKELANKYGVSECRIKEIVTKRKNNWQNV